MNSSKNIRTLLIVEDAKDIQDLLKTIFLGEGYEVHCASNGEVALEWLKNASELPGAILLDLMMPVMDGIDFCKTKHEDPRISNIPVLLMTAAGNNSYEAINPFLKASIRKPFGSIDFLLETVERIYAG
jgi:two-component system chemotaxis response regulator CheY